MARDFKMEAQKIINEYLNSRTSKNSSLIKAQNALLNQYKKQQNITTTQGNIAKGENIRDIQKSQKVKKTEPIRNIQTKKVSKSQSKTQTDLLSVNSILNISLLSTLIMVAVLVYQIIS